MKQPGTLSIVDGRYQLEHVLGEGGFSTVYAARELATGRIVAIKLLTPDAGSGYALSTRQRIQRELRSLGSLRSPHTVKLLHNGTTSDGVLYAVFEYLEGVELAQLLRQRGTLAPAEVEHVLRQLLESLEEAHRHGVLHRDLKPENILITTHYDDPLFAKVIDFGIARPLDDGSPSITKTGELIGTPRYMSPEQLTEKPLTPASDLYSLGMIAYEMALGRDALQGGAWGDQLDRLKSGHVFSVPELERVGTRLHRVIVKMTAREPAMRFQAASQVLAELDGRAAPTPAQLTAPGHAGTWRVAGVVGLVMLLILIALFGSRDPEPKLPSVVPRARVDRVVTPLLQASEERDAADIDSRPDEPAPRGSIGCIDGLWPPPPREGLYLPKNAERRPMPLVVLPQQAHRTRCLPGRQRVQGTRRPRQLHGRRAQEHTDRVERAVEPQRAPQER